VTEDFKVGDRVVSIPKFVWGDGSYRTGVGTVIERDVNGVSVKVDWVGGSAPKWINVVHLKLATVVDEVAHL
jgi:hypothetical protein